MSSCILTVIKNEHLYLDEWISYHLGIGISHIFIFEDLESESHKSITDKYGKFVTLDSVLSILSYEQKLNIIDYRKQNDGGWQKVYFQEGLRFIKEKYHYDWCFAIDNDEFITINEPLDIILNRYENYDALILSWECYGANGLIDMPDYSKCGVLDTYTTPISGHVPATSKTHNKKTCYNMRLYRTGFWNNNHIPTDECNFCNTQFVKDSESSVYDSIYIRHYITKSWEEYVWKKLCRKYFYGKIRTLDNFFIINMDMYKLKNQLISKLKEETLVVLPYSQLKSQGSEIKLALSAWKKFCKSRYHFVVIGDFDNSLKRDFPWVEFIEIPQANRISGQYYPHIDIQNKMEIAFIFFHNKYPGFIWMVDDNYAIKPFEIYELKNIHYHQLSFTGVKNDPTWFWKHDKWKTRQLLDRENLPHVNYTTHLPCYFEFEKLIDIWSKYDLKNNSYVVEDIYFNSYVHEPPVFDERIRLGIWNTKDTSDKIKKAIDDPRIKFICNSVEGWSPELEEQLGRIIYE